jgi:hypothetical protein
MKYKSPTSTSCFSIELSQKTCFNESTIEQSLKKQSTIQRTRDKATWPTLKPPEG